MRTYRHAPADAADAADAAADTRDDGMTVPPSCIVAARAVECGLVSVRRVFFLC